MNVLQVEILNPSVLNILQTLADKKDIRFNSEPYNELYIRMQNEKLEASERAVSEGRVLSHADVKKNAMQWIAEKR